MTATRYGVGVWAFGNLGDRFLLDGYRPDAASSLDEIFRQATAIEGLDGLEFNVPIHTTIRNVDILRALLGGGGLSCLALGVEVTADPKWRYGSLSSSDAAVRSEAIAIHKEALDVAAELQTPVVNSWLGQDGHDVAFQQDYMEAWSRLVEAYREIGAHRQDVRLAIEYKPREPRVRSLVPNVGMALLAAQETGLENVGVTIDVGHAFHAGENIAQAAVHAARRGRLFHVHMNDNGRGWDDDLPVGTIHTIEFLELLAWLRRVEYRGPLSLDIFPYREKPAEAIAYSIHVLKGLEKVLDGLGGDALVRGLSQDEALAVHQRIAATLTPWT